ncbi:MAG: glycosyl hydrolase family 18 protein [Candidatus Dormibacteria bacterium]
MATFVAGAVMHAMLPAQPATAAPERPAGDLPSVMQTYDLLHHADRLPFSPASAGPPAPSSRQRLLNTYNHSGLTREVLGFATYYELANGDLSDLRFQDLGSIAYFGLTLDGTGKVVKSTGGQPDAGWSGWNSSALADLVTRAHAAGDRVQLVAKSFSNADIEGIVSNQANGQAAINSILAEVQAKGVDGVNIDFEGTYNSYPNIQQQFAQWVGSLRNALGSTYQLTLDAYASAGTEPSFMDVAALAPAVDAFFIMAYGIDSGVSPTAPLGGSRWHYTDTAAVDGFVTRAGSPLKVILGVPYYGQKFSTTSNTFAAPMQPAGPGNPDFPTYDQVLSDLSCAVASDGGVTNWDPDSSTPWGYWTSPASNDPCGGNYGSTREVYYDDARSLGLKYDVVLNRGIRGAGIWALGFDHGQATLWRALESHFMTGRLHPLSPVRILDTRPGQESATNPYSGQTLGPDGTLAVQVTGGNTGVDPAATAVVLNVTAANTQRAGGFLTVWPTGQSRPTASNLNFGPNQTVPNLAIVGVGQGGSVSVYNFNGNTDVIFDVEGFFIPEGTPAGLFHPLPPARVADTRPGSGRQGAGQTLAAGAYLDLAVAGQGQVPNSGVAAVALNVTAVPTPQTKPGGFLTVFPAGGSGVAPSASNLNFGPGPAVPNRVVVKLGGGAVRLYNYSGLTDVVVDVNGWFGDGSSPDSSGTGFTPVVPGRLLDTRLSGEGPALGPGAKRRLRVAGSAGVDPGATAAVVNFTATETTAAGGFVTVYPAVAGAVDSGTPPAASDLNFGPNQTIANLAIVGLGNGAVDIYNYNGSTGLLADVAGWFQ